MGLEGRLSAASHHSNGFSFWDDGGWDGWVGTGAVEAEWSWLVHCMHACICR